MLYYHKCHDCLTPFACSERHVDLCDCNGPVQYMGQVHGDKYVQMANKSPCDGRCTHASGPHCDCGCGGANHGTGRVVSVVVQEGKVKVVDPNSDIHDDMVRGYKYREVRDYAESLYNKLFGQLPRWDKDARNARYELNKILGLKVYDRRQQALIGFIAKHIHSLPEGEIDEHT